MRGNDHRLTERGTSVADTERVFLQMLWGAWDWYRWRAADPASLRETPSAS